MKKALSILFPLFLLYWAMAMIYTTDYFFDIPTYFNLEAVNQERLANGEEALGIKDLWWRRDIHFWYAKQDKVHDPIWGLSLYLHIIGSLGAVVLGALQFIPFLRQKLMKIHRLIGKVYVLGILGLGVPTGYYMSIYANGGKWAIVSFLLLSTLWLLTTYKAYHSINNRNIPQHEAWMIRSYAITLAAVTLRLWTSHLPYLIEIPRDTTVIAAAWLAWIPNMLLAEGIVWLKRRHIG